jgi:hypothetical protein
MIRSMMNLWRNAGYDLDNIVSITLDASRIGYRSDQDIHKIFKLLLERSRQVPGVEGATLSSGDLLRAMRSDVAVGVRSRAGLSPAMPGLPLPILHAVSSNYFVTVGTRVEQGRAFSAADTATSRSVMIVDATLARALWPGMNPVGQCAFFSRHAECVEVVGVAQSRRHQMLTNARPEVFIPLTQGHRYRFSSVVPRSLFVRLENPPQTVTVTRLAAAVRGVVPNLPAITVQRLEDLANVQARAFRLGSSIFALLGMFAIAMSGVGVFGALAFTVRRHTREIGIRMALGARRRAVIAAVCGKVCWAVATGVILGIILVVVIADFARLLLFGVEPLDPVAMVCAAIVLLSAAVSGAIVPAIRAATIDPSSALRRT